MCGRGGAREVPGGGASKVRAGPLPRTGAAAAAVAIGIGIGIACDAVKQVICSTAGIDCMLPKNAGSSFDGLLWVLFRDGRVSTLFFNIYPSPTRMAAGVSWMLYTTRVRTIPQLDIHGAHCQGGCQLFI